MGAPTLMTTSDSGETYQFASSVFGIGGVEIRSSRNGDLLRAGPEWDAGADYTPEGSQIRIPNGKTKTWSDGPYARYISPPGDIAAATEPTLTPAFARVLILYYGLYLWANRGGGIRDPNHWLGLYQNALSGDPRVPGDVGVIGTLKKQYFASGVAAVPAEQAWWRSHDLG